MKLTRSSTVHVLLGTVYSRRVYTVRARGAGPGHGPIMLLGLLNKAALHSNQSHTESFLSLAPLHTMGDKRGTNTLDPEP